MSAIASTPEVNETKRRPTSEIGCGTGDRVFPGEFLILPVLNIERVLVALGERGLGKLLEGIGHEAIDDGSKGGVGSPH
jgi:hypothetical protein